MFCSRAPHAISHLSKIQKLLERINLEIEEVLRLVTVLGSTERVHGGQRTNTAKNVTTGTVIDSPELITLKLCTPKSMLVKHDGRANKFREDVNNAMFFFGKHILFCPRDLCTRQTGYILGHNKTQAIIVF